MDRLKQLIAGGFAEWSLTRVDPPRGDRIKGQFPAQEYTEEVSTTWQTIPIPRRAVPHEQWVRGEVEAATLVVRVWAGDAFKDVRQDVDKIKGLVRPDPALGRPPIYRFAWGSIEYDCIVESVGGVRYEELWPDGRIKGATFALTLRRIGDPLALAPTDPSAPPHLSRYLPAKRGDTHEAMALGQYNNPMLGVLVRQDGVVAFPLAGQVVRFPRASYYRRREIAPKAYALGGDSAAVTARRELLNDRSRATTMPFVGLRS